MKRTAWPVFPLLLALYSPLVYYASNTDTFHRWHFLAMPLLITVSVTVLAGLLLLGITRRRTDAVVAATLVALWFPNYAPIEETVALLARTGGTEPVPWAGAASLLGILVLFLLSRHGAVRLSRLIPAMNVGAIVLCVLPLITIFRARQLPLVPRITLPSLDSLAGNLSGDQRRSVILIILDTYTGSGSLRGNWGFDNNEFLGALTDRGFVVPETSRSNYISTFVSVASLLNASYLDQALSHVEPTDSRWAAAFDLSRDNAVARTFREAGYRHVLIPSYFGSTTDGVGADSVLRPPWGERSLLESRWRSRSGLTLFSRLMCRRRDCTRWHRSDPQHPAALEWRIQALASLPLNAQPHFVVAHLVAPHWPYVLDPHCRHRWPGWRRRTLGDTLMERVYYLGQIQCLNTRLLQLVDAWAVARLIPAPIILLQSDHGHGRIWTPHIATVEETPPWSVRERFDVFAAYRVPEEQAAGYAQVRTPVNLFREVLRNELGLDLPALGDRHFWNSRAHPYVFTEVSLPSERAEVP